MGKIMNLNEAKTILKKNFYIIEKKVSNEEDLATFLDKELRKEKLGTARYDGQGCIKVTTMDCGCTVCNICWDEDDLCVCHNDKGKWFADIESQRDDIKKYVEGLVKKANKKQKED